MNDEWKAAIAQAMAGARQQQFFIALMENQDLVVGNLITQWESYGSAIKENEMFLESISKRVDGLVNALSRRGIDLNAGEIVSTGTCTGIVYLEQGQKAVADYGALGAIEVTFV